MRSPIDIKKALICVFATGIALRIAAIAVLKPHFIDYYCFADATRAMLHGNDPFQLQNLHWVQWRVAPLVFPGLLPLFLPFAVFPPDLGKYLYFIANAAAGLAAYSLVVRASGLCRNFSLRTPRLDTVAVFFGAFLFANSIFYTLCLRVGQVSNFAALALIASFVAESGRTRGLAFGCAAVFKYSNIPFWAVTYLVRRQWRVCGAGFVVFAILAASPAVFGHNLWDLYSAYVNCLEEWMRPGGGNDFATSGQTMLSLGFPRSVLISTIAKITLIALFMLAIARHRNRAARTYPIHMSLCTACITLCLVYHRIYDGTLMYPLILVCTAQAYRRGKVAHAACLAGFAIVFALPGAVFERTGKLLGAAIGENAFVFTPEGQFPVVALLFFALTCYATVASAFFDDSDEFES